MCVGHTNKRVIWVNSGILSRKTTPDNSKYTYTILFGDRDDFRLEEGYKGEGRSASRSRVISIPTLAERETVGRNRERCYW